MVLFGDLFIYFAFFVFPLFGALKDLIRDHGTIIRTEITCKKIRSYMRNSAWKWCIVKKTKIF